MSVLTYQQVFAVLGLLSAGLVCEACFSSTGIAQDSTELRAEIGSASLPEYPLQHHSALPSAELDRTQQNKTGCPKKLETLVQICSRYQELTPLAATVSTLLENTASVPGIATREAVVLPYEFGSHELVSDLVGRIL